MADFTAFLEIDLTPELLPHADPLAGVGAGDITNVVEINYFVGSPPAATQFLQRMIDTGLGTYVYFTRESVDPTTPALGITETEPNNTGAFDFNTHSILAEI